MQGKLYYFISSHGENPVKRFIDSLNATQQSKVLRILRTFEEYSFQPVLPHLKKLVGTPLWEIRILGKDNIRIFYMAVGKNSILVLHGFIKKTQKTDEKEINLAIKRYNEYLNNDY